jgi:predicted ATPase/DNA-binding response OmpR family regulator
MSTKLVIAIVDDDESAREGTADLIKSMGFIAKAFPHAGGFLQSDSIGCTACLITDVRMPGMTGLELQERLVRSGNVIPTILVTAFPNDRDRAQAMRSGITCYLTKPFSEDELLECIRVAFPAHLTPGSQGRAQKLLMVAEKEVGQAAVEREYAPAVQFGRFRLHARRRELLADGIFVPIGSRALDILMVLIEARGELVTKDELLSRVWPGTVVEENTLQFQISTIRKVLGEDRDFIKTISGRGYRFVSEIIELTSQNDTAFAPVAAPQCPPLSPSTNLWAPTSDFIGREVQFQEAANLVEAHRLVTLAGVGGAGKTRLGIELARHLLPKFADGVWIVELGLLSDAELVVPAIATVLGIAGDLVSPKQLAAALASKRVLLVLDNCEHVIDTAARIAEAFLHGSATVRMIATSREPLRVDGECVYPVPPLDVPGAGVEHFNDMTQYSAVQLFIARARAAEPRLLLDERFGAAMAEICRRLDGIPLAIEFAASRAAVLGIEELADGLDQCFDLLTGGRRTASPRHQTLRANFDWSHELLTETERMVLRRLAIFAGGFRFEAAIGIAASAEITRREVVDCLADLVAKSLVTADVEGAIMRYRLLETTRAYMLEKLIASGECDEIARRHTEYFLNGFQRATVESGGRPVAKRPAICSPDMDNARAPLDWAVSPSGDASVSVALIGASVPHGSQSSRLEESRGRCETALASNARIPPLAAHAVSLRLVNGTVPRTAAAWAKTLEFTDALDQPAY